MNFSTYTVPYMMNGKEIPTTVFISVVLAFVCFLGGYWFSRYRTGLQQSVGSGSTELQDEVTELKRTADEYGRGYRAATERLSQIGERVSGLIGQYEEGVDDIDELISLVREQKKVLEDIRTLSRYSADSGNSLLNSGDSKNKE